MADSDSNVKGVRVRNNSLYLDFHYRSIRHRENLELPPTPKNIKYAAQLLYDVQRACKLKKYDRNDFFKPKDDSPRTNLEDYSNYWLKQIKVQDRTRITYRNSLHHLCKHFGAKDLKAITHKELQAYIDTSSLGAKTITNRIGTLSALFNFAILHDVCLVNPTTKVKLPKKAPAGSTINPFTTTELQKVLAQLMRDGETALHGLVWFMAETGLRPSEAFCLTYRDLNLVQGREYVNVWRSLDVRRETDADYRYKVPKNGKTRKVSLTSAAIAAVESLSVAPVKARNSDDFIFVNPRSGKLWDGSHLNDGTFRVALNRAKVPYRPLRCLRHTFASQLVSQEYHLMYVAKQLGHGSTQVTEAHYAQFMTDADEVMLARRNAAKTVLKLVG